MRFVLAILSLLVSAPASRPVLPQEGCQSTSQLCPDLCGAWNFQGDSLDGHPCAYYQVTQINVCDGTGRPSAGSCEQCSPCNVVMRVRVVWETGTGTQCLCTVPFTATATFPSGGSSAWSGPRGDITQFWRTSADCGTWSEPMDLIFGPCHDGGGNTVDFRHHLTCDNCEG